MKRISFTMTLVFVLALAGVTLVSPMSAFAEKGGITLETIGEVEITVVNDKGQKEIKRVPAEKVVPGDVVIYTTKFHNKGSESAAKVVITNPIPQHMEYVGGSATGVGTGIKFSIDQGASFDNPGNLKVKNPDGTMRTANASEYTTVRWSFIKALTPAEKGSVEFSARLK